jgi:hypothetical protein
LAGLISIAFASFPEPEIPWNPERYICYRCDAPLKIDGTIDEEAWTKAEWTAAFIDIEGAAKPIPRFRTRAKMLWDDVYFYVSAEMEEPHVWGTLVERDAVIFHDNDFEVFIDPNEDTHEYYELEVNALGTEWDLLLVKPYRDGGPAIDSWDIQGLKTAVAVEGTLNDPADEDVGWSIEIAMPWTVLEECAHKPAPPESGDQWRVNFSRVEWKVEVKDGRYAKLTDLRTGKPFPEDNWVWSPQGLINMHYPEMWGIVQFSDRMVGEGVDEFILRPDDPARGALRDLYYRQKSWHDEHGSYADDLSILYPGSQPLTSPYPWPPQLETTLNFFEAILSRPDGRRLHISHDGRLWSSD